MPDAETPVAETVEPEAEAAPAPPPEPQIELPVSGLPETDSPSLSALTAEKGCLQC